MEIVRQSLALIFVFLLLGAALWMLRKRGWTAMGRAKAVPDILESRAKLALTARHSLHLVRIGDRNLVLALHPDGITYLGDAVPSADRERPGMATT